jgi:hypothetical protein
VGLVKNKIMSRGRNNLMFFINMKRSPLQKLFAIYAVAFVIFIIISLIAGGDAVNGKIENGHYYLCSHGKYTETSKTFYVISAGFVMLIGAMWAIPLFIYFAYCCLPPWRGEGISKLGLITFIGLFCAGMSTLTYISLRCILRAFGIM